MLIRIAIPALFFFSGFTALVYQVLWLKELGLVFGNTAQAAATTLAVFFLGLAAGGYWWGRQAGNLTNLLRAYAWLELGIAASAVLYFGLSKTYRLLYEPLYTSLSDNPAFLVAAKFLLALAVLFPPSFLMGGAFPVVGQYVVSTPALLGRIGSFYYAINTLGAAAGALAAGFYLPRLLGFQRSYLFAIGLNLLIALAAWLLSRPVPPSRTQPSSPDNRPPMSPGNPSAVWTIAIFSGILTLALEVVWTRMFAQVLQNSVYTFAALLVTFLVALGLGSFVANRLCRMRAGSRPVLAVLLTLSGSTVALTPFAFYHFTSGFGYLGSGRGWHAYMASVFAATFLILLVPGVLAGSIFPYLLKAIQESRINAGAAIGNLLALNNTGGVIGAVAAGFLLLPAFGMWGTLRLLALAYLLLGLLLVPGGLKRRAALRAVPIICLLLLFTWLDPTRLPVTRIQADRNDRELQAWESISGSVAVIDRNGSLSIKVNNHYRLGGTAAMETELNQTLIPLMTHPQPDSVFYLGLGTGITAGAAMRQPTKRVVVCELIPEVIHAGELYFNDVTQGLFTDPRTVLLAEDGRNRLAGSPEQYDAIISDLFIPWRAGNGSLYSVEHFRTAESRLEPGGIFVQWLPLYQVSKNEFFTIARTMLSVFPQVLLWRGAFRPDRPLIAFIGSAEQTALLPQVLADRGRYLSGGAPIPEEATLAVTLPFYIGNLSAAREIIPPGPINTDDRPIIEYMAPRTNRDEQAGKVGWFQSLDLVEFYDQLWEKVPPKSDPYLGWLSSRELGFVEAGLNYFKYATYKKLGQEANARRYLETFRSQVPIQFAPDIDAAEAGPTVTE